ncbi:hypothetical protein AHF37_05557 [Paragonimus kellicotti]|nr:hypothetical protein AHF37_05557 [Paragonimus kellicotti]
MDCKDNIKRLLHGIESYNPEHILVLEQHLHWQITNSEYDFEANLALLRLYQFYPEHFNVDATKLVLLKALSSLNPTDFNLCKYLIRLDHLNKEPLSLVVELGLLLEACQFTEFWLRLRENPNVTSGVPDFRDAMLKYRTNCQSDVPTYIETHAQLFPGRFRRGTETDNQTKWMDRMPLYAASQFRWAMDSSEQTRGECEISEDSGTRQF